MSRILPSSLNGHASSPKTPKAKPQAPEAQTTKRTTVAVMRYRSTIALGVLMPVLSLALSWGGGVLLAEPEPVVVALGLMAMSLMGLVLAVSLEHLAWAIADLSRSGRWQSWALAIAMDMTIVWAKLTHVYASQKGIAWLTWVLMVLVIGASMWLNCWAFVQHPKHPTK